MFNAHYFKILFPTYPDYGWEFWATYSGSERSPNPVSESDRHLDLDGDGLLRILDLNLWYEGEGYPLPSADNARLVALSDAQLVFLLSLIRKTEYPEAWHMAWGDTGTSAPSYPSQPLNGWAYGRVLAWLEDLKEQLMVDVRPELNAMVAAQNEMSDDLDAIRIALEQIAADIDAADNAEKLENIANMIGLLVTLL